MIVNYIIIFIAGLAIGYAARYIHFDSKLNVVNQVGKEMAKELENYIVQINKAIKKCKGFNLIVEEVDAHYAETLAVIFRKQGFDVKLDNRNYWSNDNKTDIIITWDITLGGDKHKN